LFQPTIVSDVVIATVFGFVVAFAIYWWFSKSRGALRFIDLISFGIGFLAICSGLFAVYHYMSESTKNQRHWTFKLDASEASLDARFDMLTSCERIPHTPYRLPSIRIAECEKLEQYLKTLKVNDEFPMPLVLPNVALYTDPIVQQLAQSVAKSVANANEAIKAYNEDVAHHDKLTFLEVSGSSICQCLHGRLDLASADERLTYTEIYRTPRDSDFKNSAAIASPNRLPNALLDIFRPSFRSN
jgi:hypothetical protein